MDIKKKGRARTGGGGVRPEAAAEVSSGMLSGNVARLLEVLGTWGSRKRDPKNGLHGRKDARTDQLAKTGGIREGK